MDLTRRGLIGRALAGGGALVAGSLLRGEELAFAGSAGERVFSARVPRSGAARVSAVAGWRSGAIETERPFELLGIELLDGRDPHAQVRARLAGGRWTEWLDVPAAGGHGPDAGGADAGGADAARSASRHADAGRLSDPVWTGRARAYELRARRPLHGARVVFVDPGRPRAAMSARRGYVETDLAAGPGQPRVIGRDAWATRACRPRDFPSLGAIDLVFVHHTVSSNRYRRSQSAGIVRSICLFHKYGNGWDDIGYNFVVDRFGQVFEARAGGIDEPIVGAQAGGFNVYSSGIALLGTFSSATPTARAFGALAEVVAWKLALHGVPVRGDVTVEVTRSGAPYTRHRPGTGVRLNRVAGHGDADATSCPGAAMHRRLPGLRRAADAMAGAPLSLSAGQLGPPGPGSTAVAGVLAGATGPVAGAAIEVQRRTSRGRITVATATTAADGTWLTAAALPRNASVRAVFRGDYERPAVVSRPFDVEVAPAIELSASATRILPGAVVLFSGTVLPRKRRVELVIAQRRLDGTLTTVRSVPFATDDGGAFERTIGFPAAGQFEVSVITAADAAAAAGASAPVAVTVGG